MPEKKSFLQLLLQDAVSRNPILIQMLAICTVMAAGTLKLAAIFSGAFCVMFFVTQTLANLFMTRWSRYFRVAAYAAIGTVCAFGLLLMMESSDDSAFTVNAGIYLTMIAVSGVTVLHCEKVAVNVEFMDSLREAVVRAVGYCSVMLLTGALRELLGAGALWGHTVLPGFGIPFFAHPMSSLLLLGVMAAVLRVAVHQYVWPFVEEVALKISETPVTAAEPEPEEMPEEAEYESVLPEGGTADEIPRPIGYSLPELDRPEEEPPAEIPPETPEREITVQPAELEDTQQKFEDMLADLRKRYLDNDA